MSESPTPQDRPQEPQPSLEQVHALRAHILELEEALRSALHSASQASNVQPARSSTSPLGEGLVALFEGIREGAAILALNGTVLTCNPRLAEMLKLDRALVTGHFVAQFVTPEDQSHLEALLQSAPTEFQRLPVRLSGRNTFPLPVELAIKSLSVDGIRVFGLLATDLSRRRRAEELLVFHAQLLENVSDAVLGMDEHFRLTYWNAAAERLYGWTADEVLGRTVSEVVHPELSATEQNELSSQLAEKGMFDNQSAHRRKDGRTILVEARRIALHAPDGRMTGYVSVNRDVTEQKHAEESLRQAMHEIRALNEQLERRVHERTSQLLVANAGLERQNAERQQVEEALRESETRYRQLVELSPDAIALHREGRLVFINAAGAQLLGAASPEELIGRSILDFVHPHYRAIVQKRVRASSEHGQGAALLEEKFVRLDGRIIDVEVANIPSTYQGELAIQVVVRDITERRRVQAERERLLTENQRRMAELHAIVTSIADGLVIYDANGKIVFTNATAEKMLGYSAADDLPTIAERTAIAQPESEDGHPLELDQVPSARALRGETVRDAVLRLPRAGWVRVSAAPLYDHTGHRQGAVSIMTDFTERKQAEARIRQLNRDLEQRAVELETANQELESFSYSVSHDLRAPLASIDAFSVVLEEHYGTRLPSEAQRYLALIRSNTQQMEQLIASLLSLSRLTRHALKKQTVNMTALVREALETLQKEAQRPDLTLDLKDLPDAEADPVLLKQVWVNLLANAFKFTQRSGNARIEIGCGPCDRAEPVYYVRDNGVGFDMGQADGLFGVFKRLHGEDEYEGTGIGLAIVRRIIHRHGGRVWAEGKVGEGATFYFTLA